MTLVDEKKQGMEQEKQEMENKQKKTLKRRKYLFCQLISKSFAKNKNNNIKKGPLSFIVCLK